MLFFFALHYYVVGERALADFPEHHGRLPRWDWKGALKVVQGALDCLHLEGKVRHGAFPPVKLLEERAPGAPRSIVVGHTKHFLCQCNDVPNDLLRRSVLKPVVRTAKGRRQGIGGDGLFRFVFGVDQGPAPDGRLDVRDEDCLVLLCHGHDQDQQTRSIV